MHTPKYTVEKKFKVSHSKISYNRIGKEQCKILHSVDFIEQKRDLLQELNSKLSVIEGLLKCTRVKAVHLGIFIYYLFELLK